MKTKFLYLINSLFVASAITACSDNENQYVPSDNPENNEKPEWYYNRRPTRYCIPDNIECAGTANRTYRS